MWQNGVLVGRIVRTGPEVRDLGGGGDAVVVPEAAVDSVRQHGLAGAELEDDVAELPREVDAGVRYLPVNELPPVHLLPEPVDHLGGTGAGRVGVGPLRLDGERVALRGIAGRAVVRPGSSHVPLAGVL